MVRREPSGKQMRKLAIHLQWLLLIYLLSLMWPISRQIVRLPTSQPMNHGCTMAQTVIRRPRTLELRFQSQFIPCVICEERTGDVRGFAPSTSVYP